MADLKDDIEKYLNGQLGPEERHALEKKALSDPFLFDALGGAESIGANEFLEAVRGLDRRTSGRRESVFQWSVGKLRRELHYWSAPLMSYTLHLDQMIPDIGSKSFTRGRCNFRK